MVATDYHAATDLQRKQRPNESLQDYIVYWMEMCHHSIKMDPSTIKNKLVIGLFVTNMYNKEIHRGVAGAKNINTLLNAFKSAQLNLLKLRKYEVLVTDDDSGHTVHTVNQIPSKGIEPTKSDGSSTPIDGHGQKMFHLQMINYPISTSNSKCIKTHTNSSNHTLLPAIHVAYMVI